MRYFSLIAVLILAAIPAAGGELTVTIPFDVSSVQLGEMGPYTTVHVPGASLITDIGLPSMPQVNLRVALPTGCRANEVTVVDVSYSSLRGSFNVLPATEQVPFSLMGSVDIPMPEPDEFVYSSGEYFPREEIILQNSSVLLGIPMAWLTFHPVRWNPLQGNLEVIDNITITVSYEYDPEVQSITRRSLQSETRSQEIARRAVVNPLDVSHSGAIIVPSRDLAYGEYVIIATPTYESYANTLATWKTRKGVPTNVYTTTWIQSQYSCIDLPQEIRAFLTDCKTEGVEYVLIWGDDNVIAGRDAKISYSSYTEYPPVDLYFRDNNDTAPGADLWDSSGNGVWGEFGVDNVDYHPDFWTGRASVNSTTEALEFIDKVLIYENVNFVDYFETTPRELRVGYTTEQLWPGCWGSAGAELISPYVPGGGWEEAKCYNSSGNNSVTITNNMINDGPHHLYHASHGSSTSFSLPGGSYTNSHFMNQTNISSGGLPAIWNSISCLIGHLDGVECMGDAWLASPNGGGFGAFNARYGWGNPSSPGMGVSEVLSRNFYVAHWNNGQIPLGVAHAMGSDMMSPPGSAVQDWCVKEYNLFGEPELSLWTLEAADMSVSHPATIPGATTVTVTVNTAKAPVVGARVCLQKGNWQTGEIYEVELTNSSGQVNIGVNPTTSGTILVTVWAHNYVPYLGSITVTGTGVGGTSGDIFVNAVHSVFPSPAALSATVSFSIADAGHTTVQVFDLSGRIVTNLAGEDMLAGNHSLVWDLTDGNGIAVPAGIYHVMITSGSFSGVSNLVVIR